MTKINKIVVITLVVIFFIALFYLISTQVRKAGEISESSLIKPKSLTFDHSLDKNTLNKMIMGARLYYTFGIRVNLNI